MSRAHNIANALTHISGTIQTPLLRRGWGWVFLLTAVILLSAMPRYAHAQTNTGAAPYLESEHTYQVQIGEVANNRKWVVTDDPATGSFPYEIEKVNYPSNGFAWFEVITPAAADRDFEQVTIRFDRTIFNTGTYYLQYYEYDNNEGLCVSARNFEIIISENEFYLTLGANYNQCNDESDSIHTYAEVDNVPDDGSEYYETEVEYTVTMHKETAYDPNSWEFDATFDQTATGFDANVTTIDGGAASVFENLGVYTVTVIGPNGGDDPFPDEVEVTLTVSFENPVLTEAYPELTVSNGMATENGTPPAYTYDNTAVYPEAPETPGDRQQEITILAIPATLDITPASGETAWSASHPLQNSTHNYTVQMGDFANNIGNANTGWHIEEASNPGVIYSTGFTLTDDGTDPNAEAEIEITDAMPLGNYVLVFTEESDAGCTTLRTYPFEVLGPFDVDIALTDPATDEERCPGISGSIVENDDIDTETSTTISYTVTLETAGYDAAWEFDLGIATAYAGGFNPADVDVPAAAITVTGGTYTVTDNYSGHVDVAALTTSVTIEVAYEGFYVNEHDITVSLTNITGSFSESDADPTNAVTHTIYSMPQPLALEGVD